MKKLFGGFLFALGILAGLASGGLVIGNVYAALVPSYTNPGGSNPLIRPDLFGDMQALVNQINANAAMATTNTIPSSALGITQASLGGLQTGAGSTPVPILATMSAVWTTVTSNCASNSVSVSVCMGIIDNSGTNFTLHWLAGK